MTINKSSSLNFLFRFNFDLLTLILKILSCNCVSRPEIVTFLRTKFVYLLRNQFPKTFIINLVIIWFFQIKLSSWKWWRNHAFIFSMFKIYDVVGFYFTFLLKIFISVVEYKLPVTLTFIFINNRDSLVDGLLNGRSLIDVTLLNASFFRLSNFIGLVQWYGFIILSKVHVTICAFMINKQCIIVINWITFMFVASVWLNSKNCVWGNTFVDFNSKGSITSIRCFHYASQERIGLNVTKYDLGSVFYLPSTWSF